MSTAALAVSRSLPDPFDPQFEDFFAGLAQYRIVIRACTSCGRRQWPPRPLCTNCHAMEFDPIQIAAEGDEGAVYTFTVVYRGFDPYFAQHVPYAVLVVDLAGFRFMGNLLHADPAELDNIECGSTVTAAFEESGGCTFLAWARANGAAR